MPSEKHTIYYGKTPIEFELVYTNRATLGITVNTDKEVLVKAPQDAALPDIYRKVERRAPWILRNRDYFDQFHPKTPPRQYVSGETHRYLGKQYRLKVIPSDTEEVKLKRGYIQIFTRDKSDKQRIKGNLDVWYRSHARIKFNEYLRECIALFRQYELPSPSLELRSMSRRWGSCNPNGKIILNPELIKAPRRCVEYVIVHEICHLINPKHDKALYSLQSRVMPDWEKWKEKLERMMA